MRAPLVLCAACMAIVMGVGEVAAQGRRTSRQPYGGGEGSRYAGRNAPSPPRQASDGGIIRWDTPNASGNFGGPGTGGGGGP